MARPLKILHLTLGADAGGLSRYITDLGLAMHRLGHQITVAGDTGAWQWLFDSMPYPYVKMPLKGGLFSYFKCGQQLTTLLNEFSPDVVHTHYRRATKLARHFRPRVAASPILYTVHLSHISLRFPRNLFTDFGDHTHVASDEAREWVIDEGKVPADHVSLIPHGVDTALYERTTPELRRAARRKLRLNDDDLVALFIGRLDYPKNEDWLLDLAARMKDKLPNLRVLLVGEGPHESLIAERIDEEGLGNHVRLEGHQVPLPYYHAADALLLPSTREGFSLVCAEAMSCGVPCLRTNTSGTSLLIEESVTGRSTPIDKEAFLSAAAEFLADPTALQKLGDNAAQMIRDEFTYGLQLQRTLDLYYRLAKLS